MIIIKNLDRIVGMTSYGLEILEAYEHWNEQVPVYVFKLQYDNSLLKNNHIPVYLERIDINEEYALYVMGFRKITEIKIDKNNFTGQINGEPYGPAEMSSAIRKALKPLFEYLSQKKS